MSGARRWGGVNLGQAPLLLVRLGLGGLFVVAGASKWGDPGGFAQEIANYQLWPGLAPYLAAVLPAMEIVAGLALLLAPLSWRRAGAAALFFITAAFTVAVGAAAARGLDISCGCFGAGSGRVTWLTVLRNLALLTAAGWLIWAWREGGAPVSHPAPADCPSHSPRPAACPSDSLAPAAGERARVRGLGFPSELRPPPRFDHRRPGRNRKETGVRGLRNSLEVSQEVIDFAGFSFEFLALSALA